MNRIFREDDGGCGVSMTGLRNWWPWWRRRRRKMRIRSRRQQQRRYMWKQKSQRIQVNVSNSRGAGVFTGSGYWRRHWSHHQSKTVTRILRRRQRHQSRKRNRQRVQGIGDNGRGWEDSMTTMEAVASQWRAWGIGDHGGGFQKGIWSQGLDNDNKGIVWGSRRDNAFEWTSPTSEAPVFSWY